LGFFANSARNQKKLDHLLADRPGAVKLEGEPGTLKRRVVGFYGPVATSSCVCAGAKGLITKTRCFQSFAQPKESKKIRHPEKSALANRSKRFPTNNAAECESAEPITEGKTTLTIE
jgi:hypothetical protein